MTSQNQKDIETVELSIDVAREMVAKRDTALKLAGTKEFIEIITEGYFKEEAARLTGLLGEKEVKDYQDEIIKDLHGIASLQRYLRQIVNQGNLLEQELEQLHHTLDDLRAEA